MKLRMSAIALATIALVACSKKEEAPAPTASTAPVAEEMVIRLGHVAPMSGPIAHLGKDNENGARMAIEDLNTEAIMLDGKKVRFELLSEDDAADPKQATSVAQKLVDAKVDGVVGHLNSGTTIPASAIYEAAQIPQISPSATNPKYTRQGFGTAFRVVADDTQLGGTLGRYAVNEEKAKRIAVIDDRTAYGQGVAEEFAKAAQGAGAEIVATEFTNDKATDFTAILTKIKSEKPDVVFFGGMDAVAGPMLRQMKSLGMDIKFMGGDGICSANLPKLAGGNLKDDTVVCAEAGGVEGEEKVGMDAFKKRYKDKYGSEVQVYAPYTYDSVMLLGNAIKQANSADPTVYLPVLAGTKGYKGVTGTISFDPKGDVENGALTLYTYKDGKRDRIAVVR